jgi:hypothetical protein
LIEQSSSGEEAFNLSVVSALEIIAIKSERLFERHISIPRPESMCVAQYVFPRLSIPKCSDRRPDISTRLVTGNMAVHVPFWKFVIGHLIEIEIDRENGAETRSTGTGRGFGGCTDFALALIEALAGAGARLLI